MLTIRRMAALLLAAILIFACLPALAEGEFSFNDLPQEIRPGKLVMLSFTAALPGDVDIILKDETDTAVKLYEAFPAKAGRNSIAFDGTSNGIAFKPGTYKLQIIASGSNVTADLTIGSQSPVLTSVIPSDTNIVPGIAWHLRAIANMQGTLTVRLEEQDALLFDGTVIAGDNDIPWDGTVSGTALPAGDYTLMVQLQDSQGFSSNAQYIPVTVEAAQESVSMPEESAGLPEETAALSEATAKPDGTPVAPADFSTSPAGSELSYWTLPMDITNEAAIWEVMTQPITVLKGDQKKSYALRASPEDGAEAVGEITYDSQGVRVLETLDNGWSLVESYSSSFHDSKIKVWGNMVQGYVKTSLLQTKTPSQKYGLIIDKLTQRMYVFKDGKKFTELAISTGLLGDPNKPYTETWAGEYLIVSRVGKFFSDNLQCDMALRFDNGNLIHQVPYTLNADGSKYFDKTEPKLGTKASHGCVRVQRKKNADGVNMSWLWDNLELNTSVLVWEDYKGRQITIPSPDTKLYYNPEGGTYYHSVANCPDVKEKFLPLTAFNYSQLEEATFANLQRCPACQPPLRQSELEAVNAAHAK
jgi:hypothetical protein